MNWQLSLRPDILQGTKEKTMSREIVSIANRQRLDVAVGGPKAAIRLLIYTGIAVLEELFAVETG